MSKFRTPLACCAIALSAIPANSGSDPVDLQPHIPVDIIGPIFSHLPVDPTGPVFPTPELEPDEIVAEERESRAAASRANRETTNEIVGSIDAAVEFCGSLSGNQYDVDCLGERLAASAEEIPLGTDYDEAREALQEASRSLSNLAAANRDGAAPLINARTRTQSTARPLRPVRQEALAAVAREANAILEETRTVLLRSAEQSQDRAIHYQRIAQAVDSSKVLLRS